MLSGIHLDAFARAALAEDLGAGDATTLAIIPADARAQAAFVAREDLVLAGVPVLAAVLAAASPDITMLDFMPDGARARRGETIGRVEGPAQALLSSERVALNCLQRLSGIATLTAAFVEAISGAHPDARTRILDTRKTTPGWRDLEKYAVSCGGATNHRRRLDDLILIKDNHLAALRDARPNPIAAAVARARERHPYLKIEVEADSLDQVEQALEAQADIILLDNMSLDDLRSAVALCRGRALCEASGRVRLETVRAIAETGVDFISAGALTHGARWVDIGLDFES